MISYEIHWWFIKRPDQIYIESCGDSRTLAISEYISKSQSSMISVKLVKVVRTDISHVVNKDK